LPEVPLERALVIDVSGDLVSEVRVRPEGPGSRVVVFVRQPVGYVVRTTAPEASR
jgi:hypothetical protein